VTAQVNSFLSDYQPSKYKVKMILLGAVSILSYSSLRKITRITFIPFDRKILPMNGCVDSNVQTET
jgi:hypothetical protein